MGEGEARLELQDLRWRAAGVDEWSSVARRPSSPSPIWAAYRECLMLPPSADEARLLLLKNGAATGGSGEAFRGPTMVWFR